MNKRAKPAQSTVVGAMFFIVLVFFSLGILYYVENNYVLYGQASQRAWDLQQERNNQRFMMGEAYVLPAKGGYKTLFFVRNEGGAPIDIVNAYLYNQSDASVSRYAVNLFLNPGQSEWVNLTKYNASFPGVLNGNYNVSLWTSLGVGASTIVVATAAGIAASSPEGNVYPVAGSLAVVSSNTAAVSSVNYNNWRWWLWRWAPGEFAMAEVNVSFSVVNNNPYPVTVYPNSSLLLYWIPTPAQLNELAVSASEYGSAFYSGVIGSALPVNQTIIVPADSVVKVTVPYYKIMLYNLTWYWIGIGRFFGQTNEVSSIFQNNPADIYVPIYPSNTTGYTFAPKVLLSYSLLGKTYNMYLNNGYFTVNVPPPPVFVTVTINGYNPYRYNGYNGNITYSYGSTSGIVSPGNTVQLNVTTGTQILLSEIPSDGSAFYGWSGVMGYNSPDSPVPSTSNPYEATLTVTGNGDVVYGNFGLQTFSISVTNTTLKVIAGKSTSTTVSISSTTGNPEGGKVNLSILGLPAGVKYTFSPASLQINLQSTSTLSLNAGSTVSPGPYQIWVVSTGSSGYGSGEIEAQQISLTISPS
ncbi:MAG: hypothetical protein ACP5T2_03435 [Thermoprotei archaeon]